tara:strand:- start:172 stop:348 length:177 start_codon:yes stop_codon:yes gene_type:complete
MKQFKDDMKQKNFWKWVEGRFHPLSKNLMKRASTGEEVEMKQIAGEYLEAFLMKIKKK